MEVVFYFCLRSSCNCSLPVSLTQPTEKVKVSATRPTPIFIPVRCFTMATPATSSVISKTRDLISTIFAGGDRWLAVSPTAEDAATVAPSTTGGAHSIVKGVPDSVLTLLREGLLRTLKKYILNNVHLEATVQGIAYDLTSPLHILNASNEASVRETVVLPLLNAIFERAIPLLSEGTTESYTVRILPEAPIELHNGRGRCPEIDYLVCLDNDAGAPICLLLVEVKKKMITERQLPQLATYTSTDSTCPLYSRRVLVSIFITPTDFALGFSALMDGTGRALPTTYFTPMMPWRDANQPLDVQSDAVLLLSILHATELERHVVDEPLPTLLLVRDKLYSTAYSPPAPRPVAGQTLNDVVRELRRKDEEIAEMKKVEKLAEVKEEVQRLEKAVNELSGVRAQVKELTPTEMVSPTRPPPQAAKALGRRTSEGRTERKLDPGLFLFTAIVLTCAHNSYWYIHHSFSVCFLYCAYNSYCMVYPSFIVGVLP